MVWLRVTSAVTILSSLGWVPMAYAQSVPTDCSMGAIPDEPLVLRVAGMPDQPLPAVRVDNGGTMQFSSDDSADVYQVLRLKMNDRAPDDVFDPVVEIATSFLVANGQSLGDKIFRKPAATGADISDTPVKVDEQVMWSVQIPIPGGQYGDYAVNLDHVFYVASARVEFAQQDGGKLAGRIHLCVPGNQTSPFNKVPSSQIEVVGSFSALVE